MLELARGYFRKSVFKTYRWLKHPRRLKKNPALRWFSRHFLDKRVWKPSRHTLAGGVAVGCFATVQMIPVQMPLSVVLAGMLRVNIPVALLLCWISNPATYVPFAMIEKSLGQWLLGLIGDPTDAWIGSLQNESLAKGLSYARYMYVGGLLGGVLAAIAGYVVTWAGWALAERFGRRAVAARDACAPDQQRP